jgi:hypothetical protein
MPLSIFYVLDYFFFSGKFKKYIASSSPSDVNLRCKSKKGNARGISFFICFSHVVVVKVFLGGDDLAIVRGWNMTLRGSSREPFQTKQYLFIAFSEEPCQSIGGLRDRWTMVILKFEKYKISSNRKRGNRNN